MTAVEPRLVIDAENPWPGLSAFDESAERYFNGRQEETAALRRLVAQGALTVLFGASGLGKTSLLKAGLFPLLRRDHILPVYVRLDFRDVTAPLIEQVKLAFQAELRALRVDAPPFGADESLWEYLHRSGLELWSEQNQLLTPLFVFDQFEEVVTLGASHRQAIGELRADLADLIENRLPAALAAGVRRSDTATAALSLDRQRYKILVSFREDFLAALEGWKRDVPSIMRNRLRLLPMSGEQAFEAVHTTAPHLASPDMATRIISFVAASREGERRGEEAGAANVSELTVEPALLSLVCHGLNEKRKQQRKPAFDEALLTGTGQAIIADFYQDSVSDLPVAVQRFIARELITESGYRKPCDVDDARRVHGVTDEQLRTLEDRRLIRREMVRGAERVELTHDLLTPVVREHRARQRETERLQRERRTRLRFGAILAGLIALAMLMGGLYYRADRLKQRAQMEAARAEKALKDAETQKGLAERATLEVEEKRRQAVESRSLAEGSRLAAESAKERAEEETRAALSHQLAGAAINATRENRDAGILFALHAIATTREPDGLVLPDALDALRRAVPAEGRFMPLPGHATEITNLAFSPDGRWVASAGDEIRIWNLAAQEEARRIDSGGCAIMEFSRDGKRLTCMGSFESRVFDVESGTALVSISNVGATGSRGIQITELQVSPDGERLLAGGGGRITLFLGGKRVTTFEASSAQFSPDGRLVVTIVDRKDGAEPGAPLQTIRISDARSGAELRVLQPKSAVRRMDLSPDGKWLVTAGADLVIWDLSSGEQASIGVGGPGCMAFSPDGARLIVSTNRALTILDPVTRRTVASVTRPPGVMPTVESAARFGRLEQLHCAVSPDGKTFVSTLPPLSPSSRSAGEVWDLSPAQPTRIRETFGSLLTFNGNGSAVADRFDEKGISVEDFASQKTLVLPAQDIRVHAVAFSPDRTRIVTGGADRRARVWDVVSGRRLHTLIGHHQPITTIAYSPDGRLIATAGIDEVAKLWDASSGRFLRDLTGNRARILGLAFTPDSKRVATAGYDATVHVWDTATGKDLTADPAPRRPSSVFSVTFSADGKQLAAMGTQAEILDSVSLEARGSVPSPPTLPLGLAWSRDGAMLAAVTSNGVHLWLRGSKWESLPRTVGGNPPASIGIAFNRDGSRLLTPGTDNTIRIWDTASRQESATLYYSPGGNERVTIKSLAFSTDETQVYAVTDDVAVYRFTLPLDGQIKEAKGRVGKGSLSDADCLKFLHQQPCPVQLRRRP